MFNLNLQRQTLALLMPAILVVFLVFLSFTRLFTIHNHSLSIAITLDLIFSVPLVHVLISKPGTHLKYSTALFFSLGLVIASLIIPKNDQFFLHEIKIWVVPVIEFLGIGFFIIQTKKALAKHAETKNSTDDFYTVFKSVSSKLLPANLASIISAEISAFYFGFFAWKKTIHNDRSFSYHKKSGIIALIGVFIFMILVETSVFHLLLARWSVKVAWLFSGISLYTALQAYGIARSICKRPIQIIGDKILIPYGILAQTTIDLKDIISVAIHDKQVVSGENVKSLSPFKKIEEPNILLNLAQLHYIEGIYGSGKAFDQLLICVDERDMFLEQIHTLLH